MVPLLSTARGNGLLYRFFINHGYGTLGWGHSSSGKGVGLHPWARHTASPRGRGLPA